MSAYLCDPYQIGRLAAYLAFHKDDARRVQYFAGSINATVEGTDLAMAIANIFAQANADSVSARYTDKDISFWGYGGLGEYVQACKAAACQPWKDDFKPHQMIGACDNFDYQACEVEDWRKSDAYALNGMVKDRAVSNLLKSLNLDKGWGLEESDATPFTGILLSDLIDRTGGLPV